MYEKAREKFGGEVISLARAAHLAQPTEPKHLPQIAALRVLNYPAGSLGLVAHLNELKRGMQETVLSGHRFGAVMASGPMSMQETVACSLSLYIYQSP